MHKTVNKAISIFILQAFLLSNIAFALPAKSTVDLPKKQDIVTTPDSIVVPRDFGLVKNKFNGTSGKLVIHIQDAHCNYEAQSNIVKILEGLIKNYSLGLVSVEGADGFIDTSWFKAFPDDEVRKEVADYFMKKGEITGPEFLSITTNFAFKLFGAETRSYYIQNLNAFTSSYPLKPETEKYFNSVKSVVNRLKGIIYNEELKTLDSKMQDYESKKLQFNDYVRYLQGLAEYHKINLRSYENFFRLVSVLIYEKKIDFNVTDKERGALIDELSKAVSKERLQELVNQSIAFKSGKIASAEYYAYLKNLAAASNIGLSKKYPNLYNYIIYNAVYSKIENEKLFGDIKNIELAVKEKLFANDDQRTLDKLSRHVDIMIGLVNIKLMNGDFDYYQANKKEFTTEYFEDFIKKKTIQYGLAYEIGPPSDAVNQSVPKLEDFYSIAVKRDKALVDNTLAAMKKEKQNIAVLVTGGFHSEGIAKLLEKEGVSYMVVCPSITKDVPTPYIEILTNQRTPLENILVGTAHAKEGSVAIPSRAQLITMSDAGFRDYIKRLNGGEKLALKIGDVREGWVEITVKGVKGAPTPVGKVDIEGFIKRTSGATGVSVATVINDLRGELYKRCKDLKLPGLATEILLNDLEDQLLSPEFQAFTVKFEDEYERRAEQRKSPGAHAVSADKVSARAQEIVATIARIEQLRADIRRYEEQKKVLPRGNVPIERRYDHEIASLNTELQQLERRLNELRATPGAEATNSSVYGLTEFNDAEVKAMRAIQRQSFAEGTYRIVTAQELGFTGLGDFRFIVHADLEARIERYNQEHGTSLPTDRIDAGTGGEEYGYSFRQAHISLYRLNALRSTEAGKKALKIIATHESKGHIAIANREIANNLGISEEDFVDFHVPGANTREVLPELGNITVRQLLAKIDARRIEEKLTRLTVTAISMNDRQMLQGALREVYRSAVRFGYKDILGDILNVFERQDISVRESLCKDSLLQVAREYPLWVRRDLIGSASQDAQVMLERWFSNSGANRDISPKDVVALIMAGGGGERVWPMSTANNPKQLTQLIDEPLLLMAVNRVIGVLGARNVYIQTIPHLRGRVIELVRPLGIPENNIFAEPKAADTAGAVGYGAAMLKKLGHGDDVMFVATADHFIDIDMTLPDGRKAFQAAYMDAARIAKNTPAIGTIGIDPEPIGKSEEYGCIEKGDPTFYANSVIANTFIEKPKDTEEDKKATRIFNDRLPDGQHRWLYNSGMFVARPETFLNAFKAVAPVYGRGFDRIANPQSTRTDEVAVFDELASYKAKGFFPHPAEPTGQRKGVSIDFVLAQPISRGETEKVALFMIPGVFKWKDIGGYKSAYEYYRDDYLDPAKGVIAANGIMKRENAYKDSSNNVVVSPDFTNIRLENCSGCFVLANDPNVKITVSGLQNAVIVYNPATKALMVTNNNPSGDNIKTMQKTLSASPILKGYVTGNPADGLLPYSMVSGSEGSTAEAGTGLGVIMDMPNKNVHLYMMPVKGHPDAVEAVVTTGELSGKIASRVQEALPAIRDAQARSERYRYCVETFSPLKFGTSGLRDMDEALTDMEVYINVRGLVRYFVSIKDRKDLPDHLKELILNGAIDRLSGLVLSGDLRPSTSRILRAVAVAILDEGCEPLYIGREPTALQVLYSLKKRLAGFMGTGSHIPLGMNGLKGNRPNGELLKQEEKIILEYVAQARAEVYWQPMNMTMFDERGFFKHPDDMSGDQRAVLAKAENILDPNNPETIANRGDAEKLYIDGRFLAAFGRSLEGVDVLFWQQSAVGRTIIPTIMRRMGANVTDVAPLDVSKGEFCSLDTEDVKEEFMQQAKELMIKHGKRMLITADGDSDRPAVFILAKNPFKNNEDDVYYLTGDKLGVLTALFLRPKFFAIPVTSNHLAIQKLRDEGIEVELTDVGSPYIAEAMYNHNGGEGTNGCEVNGGYFIGAQLFRLPADTIAKLRELNRNSTSPLAEPTGELSYLPTRDAMLPLASLLISAKMNNMTVEELIRSTFSGKYKGETSAGLVEYVSPKQLTPGCEGYKKEMGPAIAKSFSPADPKMKEVIFDAGKVMYITKGDAAETRYEADETLTREALNIKSRLENRLKSIAGLENQEIAKINFQNGVRVFWSNNETTHLRASSNAAQFRFYTLAPVEMFDPRARQIVEEAIKPRTGPLVRIIQDYIARATGAASAVAQQPAAAEQSVADLTRRSPGMYSVSAGNALISASDVDKIINLILENYSTGEEIVKAMFRGKNETEYLAVLANEANKLNKRYAAMTQEEREAAWTGLEKFYAAVAERALSVKDIEAAKGLQIMIGNTIALQNLIDNKVEGAEKIQLTANPAEMLKAVDADRGPSYINGLSIPANMIVATKEGAEGIYWRGAEGVSKLGENILQEAVYAENKPKLDRLVMYTMLHVSGFHTTVFLHDRLPGSIQHASTGKGHFQGNKLDIKRVARGEVVQFNDLYNLHGTLSRTTAQVVKAGEWPTALPHSIDYMSPLTRIAVFNDVSVEVNPELVKRFNPLMESDASALAKHIPINNKIVNYTVVNFNGKPAFVANPQAISITQIGYEEKSARTQLGREALISRLAAPAPVIITEPKQVLNVENLENSKITQYVAALNALDKVIEEGKPINQVPMIKTEKEGYAWGQPIAANLILEALGANTQEAKIALAKKLLAIQYGIPENEVTNEVIGELWVGAGAIDVGTGYNLPIEVLDVFWPNQVYGARHVGQGGESDLTAKLLASAKTLSLQMHEFCEMIRPLKDGYAYIGLKKPLSRQELVAALRKGDRSIFNRYPVEKGKLYVIPPYTIHAYDEDTFVDEVKAVNAAQDKDGTTSFGDWLKLNDEQLARVAEIVSINTPVEAAKKLIQEKLLRENKDFLTMVKRNKAGEMVDIDQEKIDKILTTLEENGSLNPVNPADFESPTILASDRNTQDSAKAEIMGLTENFVGGRYTIAPGASIGSGTLVPPDTYHVLFVEKGKVKIVPEKGEPIEAEIGQAVPILANRGSYKITSLEGEAVVSTKYKPLEEESIVIAGFEAIRANLQTVRSNKVHLLTTEKAFKRGDENTVGSWKFERNILNAISDGMVDVKTIETTSVEKLKDDLKGLVGAEKSVTYVVQLTEDELDSIKGDAEIAKLLNDTRLMVLPNVKLTENRGIPFIREIESAGVILGNTTEKDIRDKTAIAGWLKLVMSRLTGNKAIDSNMLATLLKTPDPASFADRVGILLKNLQVKLEPYKADEGVRERRQLLWSV